MGARELLRLIKAGSDREFVAHASKSTEGDFEQLAALLRHEDKSVRLQAAAFVGVAQNAQALAMTSAMLRDGDASVRAGALAAIAELGGDVNEIDGIAYILRNDVDAEVRALAVEALSILRDANADAALEQASGDSDPGVKEAIARWRGRTGR